MYEYAPKPKKIREKLLLGGFLLLAAVCFGVSSLPNIPFPAFYQLLMVFFLAGAVMITARCLMRNYIYRVEPRDTEGGDGLPDFTVTEIYGNRKTVVCRISVGDIREIEAVTKENRRELSDRRKGKSCYGYTGRLFPENLYLLAVEQEEELFFVEICADEGLLKALRNN